ncbi:MAG: alpha/beta hydrolase [Chloroflexota bacterium]
MLTETSFNTGQTVLNVASGQDNGPLFVLIHGLTGRWQGYLSIIPKLAERFTLYALDNRGHGRSQHTTGHYKLADYVADTVAFLRQLKRPLILLGHSLGGLIALDIAAQHPQLVHKLILIDPALIGTNQTPPESTQGRDYFRLLHKLWTEAATPEALAQQLAAHDIPMTMSYAERAAMLFQTDPDVVLAVLEERSIAGFDYISAMRQLTCPTLFVRADPALWSACSQADIANTKASIANLTYVAIGGAGHSVHVDQPQIFLNHLLNFLAVGGE